jgi:dTDP-4-dehydrorhamnose reductase
MKIFLTGASGLLGNALAAAFLKSGWTVHASSHREPPNQEGLKIHHLDLADTASTRKLISDIQPDVIINAAALSVPAECEANPRLSHTLNAGLPWELARLARDNGLRYIHYSTDMVFDGKEGNYKENSLTKPTNFYGEHKLEAEHRLRETYPPTCTIRLPLLMGNSPSRNRSVHESHWASWKQGRVTPLFEDEWRVPVSVSNVAELTIELIRRPDIQGLYHWAGATRLNRWEMGRLIAARLGVSENLLQKTLARSFAKFKNRPLDLTMDYSKLKALVQTEPAPFEKQLEELIVPRDY